MTLWSRSKESVDVCCSSMGINERNIKRKPVLMISIPATFILGLLLIVSCCMLIQETSQCTATRHLVGELEIQVRLLREELQQLRNKHGLEVEDCTSSAEYENTKNGEKDAKLQEIIGRLTDVTKEKAKLAAQIQVLVKEKRLLAKKLGYKLVGSTAQ